MPHDPLWMPPLSHYDEKLRLDRQRTLSHIRHLSPDVRQYLISGTTGDGWEMTDLVLDDWLDLLGDPAIVGPGHKVLIAALAPTTEGVVARARRIEAYIAARPLAATMAGITICPPVDAKASQSAIADHVRAVLAATAAPIALYQLPQITGCAFAPATFAGLAREYPRIRYFKDTSGADRVVQSAVDTGSVLLLRGAEGDYHRHGKPQGGYDGWLLSTANGFAHELRSIATNADGQAAERSDRLSHLVAALFACAAEVAVGNPFSNANRAVDHIFAYGREWRSVPAPLLVSGDRLPLSFLGKIAALLADAGFDPGAGYCNQEPKNQGDS